MPQTGTLRKGDLTCSNFGVPQDSVIVFAMTRSPVRATAEQNSALVFSML